MSSYLIFSMKTITDSIEKLTNIFQALGIVVNKFVLLMKVVINIVGYYLLVKFLTKILKTFIKFKIQNKIFA